MIDDLVIEFKVPRLSVEQRKKYFHNVNVGRLEMYDNRKGVGVKLVAKAEGNALIFRNEDELQFFVNKNKVR